MTVYDLTEKVWNFRFGTWRGRETGKADMYFLVLVAVRGNLLGARRRASRSGSRGGEVRSGDRRWDGVQT